MLWCFLRWPRHMFRKSQQRAGKNAPAFAELWHHVSQVKVFHIPCLTAILLLLLQGQILLAAAFNGDTAAASFLCELYANSTASSGTVIDPDLRGAAYHAAVAHLGGCLSLSGRAFPLLMLL